MKKQIALTFLFVLATIGLACAEDIVMNGTRMQATLIDVRTPEEFAAGHIPGAVNLPYDLIDSNSSALKGLSTESQILLYCRSGRRSAIARETLEKLGYHKVVDGGGMETLTRSLKICSAQQPC